jgi:G3E family GTPase
MLRSPAFADTLVIVNEFGEVGLDHLLVEAVEDGMVLLSAGCLCCTVRGDLVRTLEDLLRRRDNGRISPFRRVVVETTGLADPIPVLAAVLHHPYLRLRYAVDGVTTTVDALLGAATLERQPEACRQVAVADRIVVTKTDLADGVSDPELVRRLRELNPSAPKLDAADPALDMSSGGLFRPDGKIADVGDWLAAERLSHSQDHHGPDPNRHSPTISSFVLTSDRPVGQGAFDMFIDLIGSTFGGRVLRLKGLVEFADTPGRPVLVQGAGHVLHVPAVLPGWPDDDRRTRLVFIVDDVPRQAVERIWNAFSGRPAIDEPDGAALGDNPLAPSTLVR